MDFSEIKLIYLEDEPDDEVSQFFAQSDLSYASQVSPKSSMIVTEDQNCQSIEKQFRINLAALNAEPNWRASNP